MYIRLGRWSFTHPRLVVAIWVALLASIFVSVGTIGDAFDDALEVPGSDADAGFSVLEENFGGVGAGAEGSIVVISDAPVTDASVQHVFVDLISDVQGLDGVASVRSPFGENQDGQISTTGDLAGRVAFASVALSPELNQTEAGELGIEILDLAEQAERDGIRFEVGGAALAGFEPPETELIGLSFAVVVLILALGSVLAMNITIAVALAGVGGGLALTVLFSNLFTVPEFATTIGAMIGLGVGIDYALFIVNRYRRSLHDGFAPLDAAGMALDTSGRSVIFAGATVVVSLLGLLLIGVDFIAGLGIAAAATVAMTMAASVTLLPAALGFAQDRVGITKVRGLVASGGIAALLLGIGLSIQPFLIGLPIAAIALALGSFVAPLKRVVPDRPPKPVRESFWYRWSHGIQARPWTSALVGVAILVVMSIPVFDLRLGFSDESNLAESTTTRQAYELLSDGFGPGFNGPLLLATELNAPDDIDALVTLAETLASVDGVASVKGPIPNDADNPTAAILQVVPTTSPQDVVTETLVQTLRSDVVPAAMAGSGLDVFITGTVAANIDFSDYLASRTIVFFGVVLALSFLLLMMVFRSLLVPLKAVIMNILSISAAYGLVVALFQWGWGASLFGIDGAPIEPFIPMMLFAVVFGLSMDYEVFLLSRIKEEYEHTGDARNSVADGLAATAGVITAAGAIMVVVFGSFLLEDVRVIKLFGFGLASAVFLDATLVRMLLVPATMELLGDKNWWLPAWIDKVLPNLNVEGSRPDRPSESGPDPIEPRQAANV